MRNASRLSAIIMLVFAAVALPSGTGETVPASGMAAPAASGTSEKSSEPRGRAYAHQSEASGTDVERVKTLAWVLLLLHEQQGVARR